MSTNPPDFSGLFSCPLTSKPQHQSSQQLQGHGVSFDGYRVFQRISLIVVKASSSRSQNRSGQQGRHATCHMNDTRAGEIDHSHTSQWIHGKCRQETIVAPNSMNNDCCSKNHRVKNEHENVTGHFGIQIEEKNCLTGVDEACQEHGI